MRTVLMTGAGGFIGRNLVRALLSDKNYELILTDKNGSRDHFAKSPSISFYNLDVTDRDAAFDMFKRHKIDTCVHLAALVNVEDSTRNPEKTMDVNVKGTVNILDACSHNDIKNFVFASSAAVYGHPTKLPITEEHQLKPISPYGVSKMLAEKHISSYTNSKMIQKSISLRIFNAYGEGQFGNVSVITKFANRLARGLAPVIYGSGMQKRDFISINDVVNAMLLSIKSMENKSGRLESASHLIFNIGTGVATTIKDLCEQMIKLSGLDVKPTHILGNDDTDINASCADITKARDFLNFFPNNKLPVDLQRIVSSAVKTQTK
jgi:UDP-glucose 4-epimerase